LSLAFYLIKNKIFEGFLLLQVYLESQKNLEPCVFESAITYNGVPFALFLQINKTVFLFLFEKLSWGVSQGDFEAPVFSFFAEIETFSRPFFGAYDTSFLAWTRACAY
jgi:hypothetical protein